MSRRPYIKPEVVEAVEEAAKHLILAPSVKTLVIKHKLSKASIWRIIHAARDRMRAGPLEKLSQSDK